MRFHLTLAKWPHYAEQPVLVVGVEKGASPTSWGTSAASAFGENKMDTSEKPRITLPYDPENMCAPMFTAALFTTTRTWK